MSRPPPEVEQGEERMILYLIVSLWLPNSKVIDSDARYYDKASFCAAWSQVNKPPKNQFANEVHAYEIDLSSKTVREVTCDIVPAKVTIIEKP
jgi:hypothetical protein